MQVMTLELVKKKELWLWMTKENNKKMGGWYNLFERIGINKKKDKN